MGLLELLDKIDINSCGPFHFDEIEIEIEGLRRIMFVCVCVCVCVRAVAGRRLAILVVNESPKYRSQNEIK